MKQLLKLLMIVTCLMLLAFPTTAQFFSKQDSTNFKNDLEKLLKKYGLKTAGYVLNIQSNDQKGGQTAFTITNNNYVTNNYFDNKTINQAPLPIVKVLEVVYKNKEVNENLVKLNSNLHNVFYYTDTFRTYKTFIRFQYYSDSKKDNLDFKVNISTIAHVQLRYVENMFQTSQFVTDLKVVKGIRCFDPANGTYELTFYTILPIENIWHFVRFYVNDKELDIQHN